MIVYAHSDVVNRKGGFEGGYRDERTSKILAVNKIREATIRLNELTIKEETMRKKSESADSAISDIMRELQKLETERDYLRNNVEQQSKEFRTRKRQLESSQV